jgi:hypothetical protein
VARRYGPGGDFWKANPQLDPQPVRTYEVWNEPNVKIFWPPQADPEAYAALFDVAQAALRRVQPGARVVTAGLAPFQDYVARMVKARPSIARTASAIGLHPYAPTPAGVLAKVRTARRQLRAAGLGKVPLALTELGWVLAPGDDPLFVREPTRARYVTETARDLAASGCGVEDLALYSWISSEGTTPDRNRWYGIARRPGRPTASTRAWARLESDPPPLRAGRCR